MIELAKDLLKVLYYVIDMLIIFYAVYYIVTGAFVFFNKKASIIRKYRAKHKLAVIIAARNEERVIGHLLDSLDKQKYPKELYDVYVVPNNCTDNTSDVSIGAGAKIIDCTVPVSSKGEVLKYAFSYMDREKLDYDGYIIFDADNIVHNKFLSRMNDALCAGFRVAQGYRDSKNPSDTWISSCYSLFYWTQNYFFNQARMRMGWSSSINGTGFMIAKEIIDKNGFDTVTITEDIEFAAQCAINDERIAFVRDAMTYDEQPLKFTQSWKQRKRWSVGTLQCLRNYYKPLLKTAYTKGIPQCIDMLLFFLAPLMQVLAFLVIMLIVMYNMLDIQVSDFTKMLYDNKIASLVLGYMFCVLISTFVVIMEKKKIGKTIKGILTLSVFMLSWIPINIICIFKKDPSWEPIEHHRSVNIDSITTIE